MMRLTGVLSEHHLPSVTHFIPTATSGKRVESSNLQTEKLWQEEGLLGPQLSPTDLYKESHGWEEAFSLVGEAWERCTRHCKQTPTPLSM